MQAEGLGQLFVRLLTANFEEAVAARAEKRSPVFTDERLREESTAADDK
jgi:enoyl-CoA hydratase